MTTPWLDDHEAFVVESNRIEGIYAVTERDRDAHRALWSSGGIGVADLEDFTMAVAGAPLRSREGMNVVVGGHRPPKGGPDIPRRLDALLDDVAASSPFSIHNRYETLHPFMDGNGRSGRALWAWHMWLIGQDPMRLGFLHTFYYQSLRAWRT
jgi:hypothetical protein